MLNHLTCREHLDALRGEMEFQLAATRQLAEGLSEAQLAWSPENGKWSIAQLFDHLVVSYERSKPFIDAPLASGPRSDPSAPSPPYRPTRMGRWIAAGLRDPTKRLPSPAIFRPAVVPATGTAERLIAMEEELLGLIGRVRDVDLSRARSRSAVSRLVRFNLGDALEIQVVHVARHIGQAERLRAHPEFPQAR